LGTNGTAICASFCWMLTSSAAAPTTLAKLAAMMQADC